VTVTVFVLLTGLPPPAGARRRERVGMCTTYSQGGVAGVARVADGGAVL